MRVISRKKIREFWDIHPNAEVSLKCWYKVVKAISPGSFNDLRQTFPSADRHTTKSGRNLTIFDVGGNNYRLLAAIHYNTETLYIRHVLTHREYDRGDWDK